MKAGQSKQWLLAAAIIFLTLLAYQPVWHAGFIWDDDEYVTENQSLRSVEGLRKIWVKPGSTIQYYPLVFTSFWAEYHLWKLQPLGYHLVNVLLHALNAVLLWRVLRRLEVPGSWLAAAIFAVHPVQVESAAWITERKNVLSCLFYLLAALAFLRFRPLTDDKANRAWDWRFYPVMLAAFLCALLSKTVTCSLPAALLLVVWWKTGRIEKRDALAMAPLFVLGAALGLMTAGREESYARGPEWALSLVDRCLIAGRALWFYTGKLVWPHQLTFIYPRWNIDAGAWWQYAFPLAALAALMSLWLLRHRIGRGPLVAVLFFAGTLVPALGFFDLYPFRYSYVADHFQCLACIGLITLAASAGAALYQRAGPRGRDLGRLAAAIVLVMLGVSTWKQARIYQDLETLWRDTLAKNPTAWMAHNNLGLVLQQSGREMEAIEHYKQSLQINPDNAAAHNNLATALIREGRIEEAIRQCEQALAIQPNYASAHGNLGVALAQAGRVQEAIGHYEQALRAMPDDVRAHNSLGVALARLGKRQQAIEHFERVLWLKPDYSETENNLAWLLATMPPAEGGDPARAVTLAQRACQLTDNRAARDLDTLAVAYAAVGQFDHAVTTMESAIALARSDGQTQLIGELNGRLELFRHGHAYRESTNTPADSSPAF